MDFDVLELVGKGGFGTVYRARMRGADGFAKVVALKVLNPGLVAVGEMGSRLRDEARMLGLVRHRALVPVDGLVELGGRATLVMEYVEGADLKALIGAGPVPPGPALEIAAEVAAALHAASTARGPDGQALRLLHRDIKPANVRLTPLGEVKVLDFGVTRGEFAAREAGTLEFAFGTPDYMAPERLVQHDCAAGDIYSVGAVFFELITGEQLGRASTLQGRHEEFVRRRLLHLRRCLLGDDETLSPEEGRAIATDLCALLGSMLAFGIDARPRAREVERSCAQLRQRVGGETLRDWAEDEVPGAVGEVAAGDPDALAGKVLSTAASTDADGWLTGSAPDPIDEDEQPTVVPTAPPPASPVAVGSRLAARVGERPVDAAPADAPAAGPPLVSRVGVPNAGGAPTVRTPASALSWTAPAPDGDGASPALQGLDPGPVRQRPPHITASAGPAPAPAAAPRAGPGRPPVALLGAGLVVVAVLVGVALTSFDLAGAPEASPAPAPVAVAEPPPAEPTEPEADPPVVEVEAPVAPRKRAKSTGSTKPDAAAAATTAVDLNAHITLAGDAVAAWLTSREGRFPVGDVPAGSYQVEVQFPDRAPVSGGRVKVVAGQSLVLDCTTAAQRCTAR